ncbi:hypothetical protein [Pantoea cypripedii]|uniref:TumA n=1 Tax=Pantoea cypripedii TaxID=55209 RepID=A0A1X1EYW8_PANCY|nr:hypothetical protein [Pantoea cypripedii]MBP2194712.1 hypothetical protein [Pantoea cypripedii]ORM95097.1 hypothetical protein HA50_17785 [Pantoea cypripedii]
MTVQDSSQIHKKMACVQFIAEISLIANCKPSDLELALTIIAELANSETHQHSDDEFFYAAE